MKKNHNALMAFTFLSGILLGASAIALVSFRASQPAPSPARISLEEANMLYKNYYNSASPSNSVFSGFAINREQLSAISALAAENQGLSGFRVYMGYDPSAGNVGIIVGVNGSDQDITSTIYRTSSGSSGPCPTICDVNSPVTSH
jgi:hypothetical protein